MNDRVWTYEYLISMCCVTMYAMLLMILAMTVTWFFMVYRVQKSMNMKVK